MEGLKIVGWELFVSTGVVGVEEFSATLKVACKHFVSVLKQRRPYKELYQGKQYFWF